MIKEELMDMPFLLPTEIGSIALCVLLEIHSVKETNTCFFYSVRNCNEIKRNGFEGSADKFMKIGRELTHSTQNR